MKFIEWNKDKWLSKEGSILPWDKLEHFILALSGVFFICGFLKLDIIGIVGVSVLTFLLGLLWEIRDGLQGYGFSWKDFIADILGIFIAILLLGVIK